METLDKEVLEIKKFTNPKITVKGETRAWVDPLELRTLWINTGTLCNLKCANCYIESSPSNDRLEYIQTEEVVQFLDEIEREKFNTAEIGFTGGEPFLNPNMISILHKSLERGFRVLLLTNGMQPMMKKSRELMALNSKYGEKLCIRVSLDHYREEMHSKERGDRSWGPTLKGIKWLDENDFCWSLAGRTIWGETDESMRRGYKSLFESLGVFVDVEDPEQLVLFPEMENKTDVPEITTACWDILKKKPSEIMCAHSRMVVKRKGENQAEVMACTLLPYDQRFNMGLSLKESWRAISLNHEYCAKFCVLGGGSCSG